MTIHFGRLRDMSKYVSEHIPPTDNCQRFCAVCYSTTIASKRTRELLSNTRPQIFAPLQRYELVDTQQYADVGRKQVIDSCPG